MGMHSTGLSREERGAGIGGGDRVRSLKEVSDLLGISLPTLRRMISAGTGPVVTRLSERRLGIRDSHRTEWLDGRAGMSAA
jgi:predicted DNA-binding transcriptional regulator AlpA